MSPRAPRRRPDGSDATALRAALGLGPGAAVAGVDEAGRGAWAGPVCAAAVVLPAGFPRSIADALDDSKRVPPSERLRLAGLLRAHAQVSVGWGTLEEIAARNILGAALLAMERALSGLRPCPAAALVDGPCAPPGACCPTRALAGGDGRALPVAAASIAAKVARDGWMEELDGKYPGYGFARHRGYGTSAHRAALLRLGPCPAHRMTFRPLAAPASGPGVV